MDHSDRLTWQHLFLQVGHIFVRRIVLESWPVGGLTLLAFLYCCCQTSIEVRPPKHLSTCPPVHLSSIQVKNYRIKSEILAVRDRSQ